MRCHTLPMKQCLSSQHTLCPMQFTSEAVSVRLCGEPVRLLALSFDFACVDLCEAAKANVSANAWDIFCIIVFILCWVIIDTGTEFLSPRFLFLLLGVLRLSEAINSQVFLQQVKQLKLQF